MLGALAVGCGNSTRSFSGQGKMQELQMEPGQVLEARCTECSLRISGDFSGLRLLGKDNFVTLQGRANNLELDGSHNMVECLDGPETVLLKGNGNRVKISERPGRQRPQIKVEGSDQGVTYRPYKP